MCVGVISHLLDLFQPVVEGFPLCFFFLIFGFSFLRVEGFEKFLREREIAQMCEWIGDFLLHPS